MSNAYSLLDDCWLFRWRFGAPNFSITTAWQECNAEQSVRRTNADVQRFPNALGVSKHEEQLRTYLVAHDATALTMTLSALAVCQWPQPHRNLRIPTAVDTRDVRRDH